MSNFRVKSGKGLHTLSQVEIEDYKEKVRQTRTEINSAYDTLRYNKHFIVPCAVEIAGI